MKKPVMLIIFLCIIFIIFLIFYFSAHDYKLEYEVNGIKIIESYYKEDAYYTFKINYKNTNYEVISLNKYINKRRLIKNINVTEDEIGTCLDFSNSLVTIYPICSDSENYFSPYLNGSSQFNKKDTYENIQIADLNNKTYLLWNYNDFIYLNSKKESKISLFSKDIYYLNLVYQFEKYLLIPDYSKDYKFDKLYIINIENGKTSNIKLRYELYFDSYFLGNDGNKVYLYDIKNEQEYYIDLKKDEIYKASYKILVDNEWESVSNQKMKNSRLSFSNNEVFEYFLNENILLATFKGSETEFQVSTKEVSQIVKIEGLDVYFISKDTLYYFNPNIGEKALLKYSEWQFNNQNMIFIF